MGDYHLVPMEMTKNLMYGHSIKRSIMIDYVFFNFAQQNR